MYDQRDIQLSKTSLSTFPIGTHMMDMERSYRSLSDPNLFEIGPFSSQKITMMRDATNYYIVPSFSTFLRNSSKYRGLPGKSKYRGRSP